MSDNLKIATKIESFSTAGGKFKRYDKFDIGNHYSPLLDPIVLRVFYF